MTGPGGRRELWLLHRRGSNRDKPSTEETVPIPPTPALGVLAQSREVGFAWLQTRRRYVRGWGKNQQNACRNPPPELL